MIRLGPYVPPHHHRNQLRKYEAAMPYGGLKTRRIQVFSVGINLTLTLDICEPIFGNGSRFDEPKELGNQSANSWCLI